MNTPSNKLTTNLSKKEPHTTYMFTSCSREVTNGVGMFTSVISMFDLVQCVPRMEYPDVIYRRNYQYATTALLNGQILALERSK